MLAFAGSLCLFLALPLLGSVLFFAFLNVDLKGSFLEAAPYPILPLFLLAFLFFRWGTSFNDHLLFDLSTRQILNGSKTPGKETLRWRFADLHSIILRSRRESSGKNRTYLRSWIELVDQQGKTCDLVSANQSMARRAGQHLAEALGVPFDQSDPSKWIRVRRKFGEVTIERV